MRGVELAATRRAWTRRTSRPPTPGDRERVILAVQVGRKIAVLLARMEKGGRRK